MKRIRTNLAFWLLAGGLGAYMALFSLAGYEGTAYAIAALVFGASFLVITTWGSTGLRALQMGAREGEALLALAVCLFAVAAFYQRVWVIAKITFESPAWMDSSYLALFPGWLILFALTAILLAPGTTGGNVPLKNLIYWALAGALAGVVIGFLIGKETNAAPLKISCVEPKPVAVASFCRRVPTP